MRGRCLLAGALMLLLVASLARTAHEGRSVENRRKLEELDREYQLLSQRGQVLEALDRAEQALALLKQVYPAQEFPNGQKELAWGLLRMGDALRLLGRREAALEHFRQYLVMLKKLYPPEKFPNGHDDLADGLELFAVKLSSLGYQETNKVRASKYFEVSLENHLQALAMNRKLYPPEKFPNGHPRHFCCLHNIATAQSRLGRLESALEYYAETLAMHQKLGRPQGDATPSMRNMAVILTKLGRFEEALVYSKQVLDIHRKELREIRSAYREEGHDNRVRYRQEQLATSLVGVGNALQLLGRSKAALDHYGEAMGILQKLYPTEYFPDGHSLRIGILGQMGGTFLATGQYEFARNVLEEAWTFSRRSHAHIARALSEAEALAFVRSRGSYLHLYLSATIHLPGSAETTYANVWSERSSLSRILHQRHQTALVAAINNPQVQKRFNELQTIRGNLGRLLLQPLPATRQAIERRDHAVTEMTEKKQLLERELSRLLPDLDDQQQQFDWAGPIKLRKRLPDNSVFIDLVRYIRYEHDPKKPGQNGERRVDAYVAFVLSRNRDVQRVEMGEARLIEEALADWRHLIEQRKERAQVELAEKLRRLVWDRIAEHLPEGTRTIYLAPDGDLTHLPWAALPGRKPGTILLEDHTLAVVPHGPYLLEQLLSERRFGQGTGAPLVVGGVRYSDVPVLVQASPLGRARRDRANLLWTDLPGSEREMLLVQKLYGEKTIALKGRDASVSRLRRELPQTRLAHLATHGFFNEQAFRDEEHRAQQQVDHLLRSQTILSDQLGRRITVGASNPLSFAGLVLAGANQPDKAGDDGGILTAEAIVDLDLRKLELAVLSACQTGLGVVDDRECVRNLQWAFHLAGCPSVIASLWSVPDESTSALMGLFYRELQDGKSPLEALRAAQLYLYRHPAQLKDLAERAPLIAKGAKLSEPPAQPQPTAERKQTAIKDWAGFVLSGLGK